jgi:hypothetical protein
MSIRRAHKVVGVIRIVGDPAKPPAPRTFSRYKVWHDDVCKELQLEIRALVATIAPDDTYLLEPQRVYKRRVKHLVRKHRAAAVAIQKCQQWVTDRNAFGRSYKPKGATCPFPASKLAEHFKIKMNSWDQSASSPAPTDPQHNIDVTSTSAGLGEIVAAL